MSKRDFFFGIFMLVLVIFIAALSANNAVKVKFRDESVDILTSDYVMNIPYDMVEKCEMVSLEERGSSIDGIDDHNTRTGHWKNEAWGEYFICADLDVEICIAVHLDDGRLFVFNRKNPEETKRIFDIFQNYLDA